MLSYYHRLQPKATPNDLAPFLPANVLIIDGEAGLDEHLTAARRGEARVLLECPDTYPGLEFGNLRYAALDKMRTVVTSDWFGPELPPPQLLLQHLFSFREVLTPVSAHLVAARVAGYRHACYGLTDTVCFPLLFEAPDCPNVLIATTSLANFLSGRFAPAASWRLVIGRLLAFLAGREDIIPIDCQPTVRPAYSADSSLPPDAEDTAFRRSARWFSREILYHFNNDTGVFEGFSSGIDEFGRQSPMPHLRGDCLGECSAVFALNHLLLGSFSARQDALGLLKTLFTSKQVRDLDTASQTYGSLYFYSSIPQVYGDDNSRSCLGALLCEELLQDTTYAKDILEVAYSLWRTTGPNGLREPSIGPQSFKDGQTWQTYGSRNFSECRPHYQAWHWAFNLQMYELTGDNCFRDHALNAMRLAIDLFPDFLWQNGASGDWARCLLPFAFLVEIEDTPEHRQWLYRVCRQTIRHLDEHHIFREVMGDPAKGNYPAPKSNAEFGTAEATLLQQDGDPACDLLYTINFAFAGLHEAAFATGNPEYQEAANGIADFLCRIQAVSDSQHALHGAWFRAFDFEQWDFFGNASDNGWGPWCVESGWTNSWIATTLALRSLRRPLLCRAQKEVFRTLAPQVAEEMLGKE